MASEGRHLETAAAPGSAGDVLHLIRTGVAQTRADLAKHTGLAPSTVGLRVDALQRLGLVAEGGDADSTGGRRARVLRLEASAGHVGAVALGAHHVQLALTDLTGRRTASVEEPRTDLAQAPEAFAAEAWSHLQRLAAGAGLRPEGLLGLAVSVPAPIEHPGGRVVQPSFMPAWHGVSVPELFAAHTSAPVFIENDANLLAYAELHGSGWAAGAAPGADGPEHLLAVKLGTRIGCGIVSAGRLHRGASGSAGEISHTGVTGIGVIPCTCGVPACLESVASGGALVAALRQQGYDVADTAAVVRLGDAGDPAVVAQLRAAGRAIGSVLAAAANFFNPSDVVLGGVMSSSAPLVAALRAEVFERALPLTSGALDVRTAVDGADAGLRGACYLALDEVLAPARVQAMVAAAGQVA